MEEPTQPTGPRTDDNALLLLPLPKVDRQSDEQRRGAACVWCGTKLTAETARDLGERPTPDGTRIWPRACTQCVRTEARRVSNIHTRHCQRCLRNTEACTDRRALRDLALEGRRQEVQL
ncbi:hypothetical protein DF19_41625 [Streptomyces olindensis]|nr:hypothetical protein DF19_41625 [Streptomyces olindensis]